MDSNDPSEFAFRSDLTGYKLKDAEKAIVGKKFKVFHPPDDKLGEPRPWSWMVHGPLLKQDQLLEVDEGTKTCICVGLFIPNVEFNGSNTKDGEHKAARQDDTRSVRSILVSQGTLNDKHIMENVVDSVPVVVLCQTNSACYRLAVYDESGCLSALGHDGNTGMNPENVFLFQPFRDDDCSKSSDRKSKWAKLIDIHVSKEQDDSTGNPGTAPESCSGRQSPDEASLGPIEEVTPAKDLDTIDLMLAGLDATSLSAQPDAKHGLKDMIATAIYTRLTKNDPRSIDKKYPNLIKYFGITVMGIPIEAEGYTVDRTFRAECMKELCDVEPVSFKYDDVETFEAVSLCMRYFRVTRSRIEWGRLPMFLNMVVWGRRRTRGADNNRLEVENIAGALRRVSGLPHEKADSRRVDERRRQSP